MIADVILRIERVFTNKGLPIKLECGLQNKTSIDPTFKRHAHNLDTFKLLVAMLPFAPEADLVHFVSGSYFWKTAHLD